MRGISTNKNSTAYQGKLPLHHFTSGVKATLKKLVNMPIIIMLVVIWIVFMCLNNLFLTGNNMITLFAANAFFAVAAIGQVFVHMTGGIDLSIAHNLTCSAVVSALSMVSYQTTAVNAIVNPGNKVLSMTQIMILPGVDQAAVKNAIAATSGSTITIGLLIAITVGLFFGFVNGITIGVFKMTPFIITLSTQLLTRGIAYVLSNGISISGTPKELTKMSYAYGIPLSDKLVLPWIIIIMITILIIFGVILGKTNWGRYITLVGSNPQAARYVGIKVSFVISSVYIIAGFLAGIAGFMSIMCLGTADPKVGDPLLLPIIGSVILGGINPEGGEGTMTKAALGMLMFATLVNGMTFLNLTLAFQQIIFGTIIIIGTALLARLSAKRA